MYAGRQTARPAMLAPLAVTDGYIQLSDAPGFGFQIDRDAIAWNLANR
jgi:L-alanine-DL-glutamate epimerase-like enolase superfamily enzyme